jgi:hypothetical protein
MQTENGAAAVVHDVACRRIDAREAERKAKRDPKLRSGR